ncbi:MAG: flagellar export chaperone FliS [Bacillota bacterium]
MSTMSYGSDKYKEQAVVTMTQGELLVRLYDETLNRLARAEVALKVEKYDVFEESINRVVAIVNYLMSTLDGAYDISGNLMLLYEYFGYMLARIKIGRNVSLIDELKPMLEELRDAFKTASMTVEEAAL